MCVDDIVREFMRQHTRVRMLGFYYGVLLAYIFFTKLEYIASGPLHIVQSVMQDLLRELLSEDELADFQEGVTQGLVAVLSCPLFYSRFFRKTFLRSVLERIAVYGSKLYLELLLPRLTPAERALLERVVKAGLSTDDLIPQLRLEVLDCADVSRLATRLGLIVFSGSVYLPVLPRLSLGQRNI